MADGSKPKGPPRAGSSQEPFQNLDSVMPSKHQMPRQKAPTLSDVPTSELFDDDDEFTPIHGLGDLAMSLGAIKRTSAEMRVTLEHVKGSVDAQGTKLDGLGERTVNLQTRQKTSEARLKVLESDTKSLALPRPHDCHQEGDIEGIKDEGRQTRLEVQTIVSRVAVAETQVKTVKEKIKEDGEKTDKRWGRVWAIGGMLALFVLAAVGGWIATLFTMRADVQHLGAEQTKLRATVEKGARSTTESTAKMTAASTKVTEATAKLTAKLTAETDAGHLTDPLELLWCDLGDREKTRQKRIRGRDKIPTKRCPR